MEEKSIFLSIIGDSPKARILDFLLMFPKFDYPLTDIARNSNVGYSTLQLLWPDFVKREIVIQTRTIGKAKLFKLNEESPIVKEMLNWSWNLTKEVVNQENSFKEVEVPI